MRTFAVVAVALALVAGGACRKPAKVILTKDQRVRIDENILKEAPKPKVALDANFGDNVKLVGVDLSADRARAGDTLTITWYWQSLREVAGEWKVFVHLDLPGGKRMVLDHVPVGELYPVAQWKKGEIIRDVQKFTLDADAKGGQAVLWAGLFNEEIYRERGGGDRMVLVNKDKVANDGENRVRVAQFAVEAREGAARPAAILRAMKAQGPIVVDGKLDEADWIAANASQPFPAAGGGAADPKAATTIRATWDDKNLYFGFKVLDDNIETSYKNRDDELWNADDVEIYLDGLADGKDYIELQVSPANVVFDALFKSHRTPDWKDAKSFNIEGLQTAVVVNGTLNKAGDADTGYDVEVAVPLAAVAGLKVPPAPGDKLRVNFFRIEAKDGKVTGAHAFSPAGGDFHDLGRAGTLEFLGTPGQVIQKVVETAPAPAVANPPTLKIDPATVQRATGISPAVQAGRPKTTPAGTK